MLCPGNSESAGMHPALPGASYSWNITGLNVTSGANAQTVNFDIPVTNPTGDPATLICMANYRGCQYGAAKEVTTTGDLDDLVIRCGRQIMDPNPQDFCNTNNHNITTFYIENDLPFNETTITWTKLNPQYSADFLYQEVTLNGLNKGIQITLQSGGVVSFHVEVYTPCGYKSKTVTLEFPNPAYGTKCYSCSYEQFMIISPNPAIYGTDHNLTVSSTSPIQFPTSCIIKDHRGMVVDKFEVTQAIFTVPISGLHPAEYSLILDPEGLALEEKFIVAKTATDRMVVSPNPTFKDVDHSVNVKILDTQTQDTEYEITVDDWEGQRHLSFAATSREFPLDVRDLPIGSYIITATGANSSLQENLEMVLKGTPYLWINPNPATSTLNGQVHNPLREDMTYKVIITDKLGNEVKTFETTDNPFQTDISHLPADLYFIHVRNEIQLLSKIFRKL